MTSFLVPSGASKWLEFYLHYSEDHFAMHKFEGGMALMAMTVWLNASTLVIVLSVSGDKAEWAAADNDYLVQINSWSHVRLHSRNRWEFQQVRECSPVTLDKYCFVILILPYIDLGKQSLKRHWEHKDALFFLCLTGVIYLYLPLWH